MSSEREMPVKTPDEEVLGPESALPSVIWREELVARDDGPAEDLPLEPWGLVQDAAASGQDLLEDAPMDAVWLDEGAVEPHAPLDAPWTASEADAQSLVALPVLDAIDEGFADDVEGPVDPIIELSASAELLVEDDDVREGFDERAGALSGEPPGFALAAPSACAFVALSDRDAEVLERARADGLQTDDGAPGRLSRARLVRASARRGDLLAFAFVRGPGQLSLDGGERFDPAPWLEGALALAVGEGVLFAAVYDPPVDRCTILRARGGRVERVADVHALLGRDHRAEGDEVRCRVTALVCLDPHGTRLLVRTSHTSFVLSVPR
jgi:hypothetical protein